MKKISSHTLFLILAVTLLLSQVKVSWSDSGLLAEMTRLLATGRYGEAALFGEESLQSTSIPEHLRISIASMAAQAYMKSGKPGYALRLIETIHEPENSPDSGLVRLLQVTALAELANGNSAGAGRHIDEASAIAGLSTEDNAQNLFIKGMIAGQTTGREAEADALLKSAADKAGSLKTKRLLPAILLQRGKLAVKARDLPTAIGYFKSSIISAEKVSPDDDLVNVLADAGWSLHKSTRNSERKADPAVSGTALQAMTRAAEFAFRIGNLRAASNALAKAAAIAEDEEDFDAALTFAMDAINSTQKGRYADQLPSRQHLAARILKKQGRAEPALAMYRAAARNLELSKNGILPDCSSSTASYQETVRPVYLDLADLLIRSADAQASAVMQQELLLEARNTMEMLRTEEIRDYFDDACFGSGRLKMLQGNSAPGTAVLYTIFFTDRMELLASLPDGMRKVKVVRSIGDIGRDARMLRLTIENRFQNWETHAKSLYETIIRPLEKELAQQNVSRLIFVPDGPLRNIPLSVLHDGVSPVIEHFSVITLQNLAFMPQQNSRGRETGVLLAGISESVQGYPSLANVEKELDGIRGTVNNSVTLLNSEFQLRNISKQLESSPFPFLHFASHGEFTGNSRDNYILTWDGKMTLELLERFIRAGEIKKTPVEILSLSACRTAAGDDRAALGLAGLAVKSGARNSIASLWDVEDKSTSDLFIEFYRSLGAGKTTDRAEVFRKAQLTIRQRYGHPYFWSPFIFIGD